jgi:hypothetical protein
VNGLLKNNSCVMSQTGNVDEMPVYFYMPCSYTVDDNGAKSMAIETGYDRCVTVMLAVQQMVASCIHA